MVSILPYLDSILKVGRTSKIPRYDKIRKATIHFLDTLHEMEYLRNRKGNFNTYD